MSINIYKTQRNILKRSVKYKAPTFAWTVITSTRREIRGNNTRKISHGGSCVGMGVAEGHLFLSTISILNLM